MTDNFAEIYFCLNPSAVCRQAAPPSPLHITQINNVGIILECMFLKPLLKYSRRRKNLDLGTKNLFQIFYSSQKTFYSILLYTYRY